MRNAMCGLVLLMILPGCFLIVQGTRDTVRCFSDPPGAVVRLGEAKGVTPCDLHVRRFPTPQMVRFRLFDRQVASQEVVPIEGGQMNARCKGDLAWPAASTTPAVAAALASGAPGLPAPARTPPVSACPAPWRSLRVTL